MAFDNFSCVPEGIVPGPLLFVIFIKYLPDTYSDTAKIRLFADDAKVFKPIRTDRQLLCCR